MAPKMRGSSKKRASTPQEKEKRSKRRQEAPIPSHSPSGSSSRPATMSSRSVVTGRRISFQFLEDEGFNLGDWLRFQGWERFCTLNVPTYPHLVREFFENIKMCDDYFWSQVKGEDIVLDQMKICDLLNMPNEGVMYLDIINEFDGMKRLLGREDVGGLDYHNGNILPVELKLLHNMVARMFFPRTGRFDWVSRRDMAFMVHIIEQKPVNLAFLMMEQIKEAAQKGKVKACLPYGMVFTLLFIDAEINLKGEDTILLGHTDLYSLQTLKRMHFRKERGVWVRDIEGGLAAPAARASSSSSSSDSSESDSDHAEGGATRAPGTSEQPIADPDLPPSPVAPAPSTVPTPPSGTGEFDPRGVDTPQMRRQRIFDEDQITTITTMLSSKFELMFENLKGSLFKRVEASDAVAEERFTDLQAQLTGIIDRITDLDVGGSSGPPSSSAPSSISADLRAFISSELESHRAAAEGRHSDLIQQLHVLSQRLTDLEKMQPTPPDLTHINSQLSSLMKLGKELNENQKKGMKLFVDAIVDLSSRINAVVSGASTSFGYYSPASSRPMAPPTATTEARPLTVRPPFSSTVRPGVGFTPRPAGPASRTRRTRPRGGASTSTADAPHVLGSSDEE